MAIGADNSVRYKLEIEKKCGLDLKFWKFLMIGKNFLKMYMLNDLKF